MSDLYSLRSRRRVTGDQYSDTVSKVIDAEEEKKKYSQPQSNSYSHLTTVFSATSSQLWNSAQEAFSSSLPQASDVVSDDTSELPFPELTVFGEAVDKLIFTMPSRDRTAEFKTTAKSFQMKVQGNGQRPVNRHEILADSVQFNQLAKRIGRDLSMTCSKMEKLAEFAKRKSLFDERSEVDHLSRVVTEDIKNLNKQIASLQEFSSRRNGGTKTQGAGHSQLVVVGLQTKLANVSRDFQSVVEISKENRKAQRSRREMFSQADPVPMSLPSSSNNSNVRSRLLSDDEHHGGGSIALDMGAMEQYQQSQQVTRNGMQDYVQARSETMETIEGSISELGQIFTQLASLVSEQGEMITRIDSNVDETAINIDAAHTELVKYFHNISKNRWLMIKVFGVLMAFFVVFVLFLT